MQEQIFGNLTINQILIASIIVISFSGLAWLSRFLMIKYVTKLAQKTKTNLDDVLVAVLQKPLVITVILVGFYIASLILPRETTFWQYSNRCFVTALSLLCIYVALSIFSAIIKWYRQGVITKGKNVGFSLRLLSFCWIVIVIIAIWLVIILSMNIWGADTTRVTGWLGEHGWRIALIVGLAMLVIITVGELIPRIIVHTINRRPDEKADEIKKRSDTLSKILVSTVQIFVFLIAFFMILSELKIDIVPIIASASVIGVAAGFGAQSLVKDILAGIFIIVESHYRVGDIIKVAGVSGVVENINLRRTVLRDIDGIVHIVPHGEIRVASNYTKEWARVNINISVAYKENLDHVIQIINHVGDELTADPAWAPLIIKPPKALRVDNLGDSGIEIKILGETQPMQQWAVMGELRLRLKKAFDEEGIEIPWPHTKIYFGDTPIHIEKQKQVVS